MRIPSATYRLQFNSGFTFGLAMGMVQYLADLGITDVYASPVFTAVPGSMHGYDVTDPASVNPELGGEAALDELMAQTRRLGLGWVQDIVFNHMAYHPSNAMLMDLLEKGQTSRYAGFFDITCDLRPGGDSVLAPFLGRLYAEALENAEITLGFDQDGLCVRYGMLRLPARLLSYARVFEPAAVPVGAGAGGSEAGVERFHAVVDSIAAAPAGDAAECAETVHSAKAALWEAYSSDAAVKDYVDEAVARFNGEKGDARSFDCIDELLQEQHYRLCFWKVTADEINYRRFFNISDLICLRVEDEAVFEHTHALIFRYVNEGKFTGLRVDHVDGLYEPTAYLGRLRKRTGDTYIIVEKILAHDEPLRPSWPVQGTTGYEFANRLNGIFCMPEHEARFDRIYGRFVPRHAPYRELLFNKKKLIAERMMAGEAANLADLLKRIAARNRYGRDMTFGGLKKVLLEVMAVFPVYRTYEGEAWASERDRSIVNEAIRLAMQHRPDLLYELNLVQKVLLLQFDEAMSDAERAQWKHFVKRLQQFTGPLMAKGFEDTFLYLYNRLLSLNEVGGCPDRFGTSAEEFHEFNATRNRLHPHTLSATSTHDTKRGEDVRARLNVLSELPDEWGAAVLRWRMLNRGAKPAVNGHRAPDPNDEYLLYQSLVGAWPFSEQEYPAFRERVKKFMLKAVREARVHTGWLKPDAAYENACLQFVDRILEPSERNRFLAEFMPFQRRIARYGIYNSLSQTLIKIASPGVPDFYQGTELWDLQFVDPDNRRPVDFGLREKLLGELQDEIDRDLPGLPGRLLAAKAHGRIKLFLTYRALHARRERAELFQEGDYLPLDVRGVHARNVVAFARTTDASWALAVAPRFLTKVVPDDREPLGDVWSDTRILLPDDAPPSWTDAISGRTISGSDGLPVADVLRNFPVAFLTGER